MFASGELLIGQQDPAVQVDSCAVFAVDSFAVLRALERVGSKCCFQTRTKVSPELPFHSLASHGLEFVGHDYGHGYGC